jgi:hypothetical protein
VPWHLCSRASGSAARCRFGNFLFGNLLIERQLLDYDSDLATLNRHRLFKALIRLSRNSKLHPRCLTLEALEPGRQVAGGAFGDVYKASLDGQLVAVKMMRVFEDSDIDALLKV